jgi:hypothetical protein
MAVATRRVYGRRSISDLRDLQFLLVDADPITCTTPASEPRKCRRGPVLDQHDEAVSVSSALLAALYAGPQRISVSRAPHVMVLDLEARRIEGTLTRTEPISIRAGCRVLKKLGLIDGYLWTYDLDEIVNFLGSGHGLVLGIEWYAAMGKPDETGLIRAWGRPEGGHALFAFGVDPTSRTVWVQNSFGSDWGGWSARPSRRDFKGCARLPYDDLKKLLVDNGEAVVLVKRPP